MEGGKEESTTTAAAATARRRLSSSQQHRGGRYFDLIPQGFDTVPCKMCNMKCTEHYSAENSKFPKMKSSWGKNYILPPILIVVLHLVPGAGVGGGGDRDDERAGRDGPAERAAAFRQPQTDRSEEERREEGRLDGRVAARSQWRRRRRRRRRRREAGRGRRRCVARYYIRESVAKYRATCSCSCLTSTHLNFRV